MYILLTSVFHGIDMEGLVRMGKLEAAADELITIIGRRSEVLIAFHNRTLTYNSVTGVELQLNHGAESKNWTLNQFALEPTEANKLLDRLEFLFLALSLGTRS